MSHYVWIIVLNKLHYTESKHKVRIYFCECCLHGYSGEDLLEAHIQDCESVGGTAVKTPEEGNNILKFKNCHKHTKVPL